MGQREASLRLKLLNGGFIGSLEQSAKKTEAVGRRMGQALKGPTVAGLDAVKESFRSTAESVKSIGGNVLALTGALSGGALIKEGVELDNIYKNIAFAVGAASGKMITAASVQQRLEGTATRLKRTNSEMIEIFETVREDHGGRGTRVPQFERWRRGDERDGQERKGACHHHRRAAAQLQTYGRLPDQRGARQGDRVWGKGHRPVRAALRRLPRVWFAWRNKPD